MRTFCAWALMTAVAVAQQQTPTFRSGVTLVTIDVTVLDHDGRPVSGLTADDFVVKLDGFEQPVRAVAYVQSSAAMGSTASTARPAVGGALPADTRVGEPRVFIMIADDVSLSASRGQKLFTAAERFVMRLPKSDLVGFTTTTGSETINPSTDRIAVSRALAKVTGEYVDLRVRTTGDPSVGIIESLDIDQGDTTRLRAVIARECFGGQTTQVDSQAIELLLRDNDCAADVRSTARRVAVQTRTNTARQIDRLLAVINSLRGVPAIKHIVIMSDGIGMSRDFNDILPVARAAAAAGVQMSVLVDEPDLEMSDAGRESELARVDAGQAALRRSDARDMFAAIQAMADLTGGGYYRVIGSADPSFDRVALASSAVYRLGVEPRGQPVPGREFAVQASVKRPGVKVLVNRHAIAPDPNAPPTNPIPSLSHTRPASTEEQVRLALGAKELRGDVPIRIGTARRRASAGGDQLDVAVEIEVPGRAAGPLTAMFADITSPGDVRGGRIELARGGEGPYRAMLVLGLAGGQHRIRIAVADATGAVGTAEAPVPGALDAIGPFLASDLLISWIDADARSQFIALNEVPAAARAMHAAIELYPRGAAPEGEVRVLMTLTPADQRKTPIERDLAVDRADGVLRALAEFTAAEIPAGEYALRATVFLDGKPVGAKRLTVTRK